MPDSPALTPNRRMTGFDPLTMLEILHYPAISCHRIGELVEFVGLSAARV